MPALPKAMAKSKSKAKKKDILKWPRVVVPSLFVVFLLLHMIWLDANSEASWWTYFLSENCYLPTIAFALLMTILSVRRFRFTLIWLGLLAMAVVVGGHPSFGHEPGNAPTKTIRVLTYNVAHFDIERAGVLDVIRQSNADIVCIEEVCRPEAQKEARAMLEKELPGYQAISASSNMILSRHPIHMERFLDVPTKWPTKQFPIALVQTPIGPVRVMDVHMEPSWVEKLPPDFGEYIPVVSKVVKDRQAQTDLILAALRPSKVPVVMAGDFNGTPDSESIRRIREWFTDCYNATSKGFGFTLVPKLPYKRIDYVWTRDLTPVHTEVLSSTASDHLPVLAVVGK